LAIDDSLVQVHDWLAFCYVKSGMDTEAITEYEMVTQENPTTANLVNLGMALYRQGQLEEAEASLRKALVIDPGNEDAVNNLSLVLLKLNRPAEVDALTQEAIAKNKENYLAYSNLGIALIKEFRFQEAVDALTTAIKKRPDMVEAHFSLAAAYIGLGDLKKAGDQYAIYLKLGGGDAGKEKDAINFLFDQNRYYDVPLEMRDHEE
jgi:Tfp pilus assembly protein PilF